MSDIADRHRQVAATFTERAQQVPAAAWEHPAPCDGWVARDVVRHLVEWVPPFLSAGAGVGVPAGPSVDDDPVGAWTNLADAVQALLDDPVVAQREVELEHLGRRSIEDAVGTIFLGDVLIHTWDLSRATGLDESLDPAIVSEMLVGMQPMDAMLRQSGHYGPKVEVADDADDQTKLVAFTGRTP